MSLKEAAGNEIYEQIRKTVTASSIGRDTVVSVLVSLMEMAERYRSMDGADKRDVVIGTVLRVVADSSLTEDEKRLLETFPYGDVIDFVVAASRKVLAINKGKWCC